MRLVQVETFIESFIESFVETCIETFVETFNGTFIETFNETWDSPWPSSARSLWSWPLESVSAKEACYLNISISQDSTSS